MSRILGPVVSSVIRLVDVDGVVRQIDINDAVERIDIESVLDRVDWNRILDKVDVNHHLDRVDLDALLDKVDIDKLVDRSNISAIVARSSTGIFGQLLDGLRSQVAAVDQIVQGIPRCACCSKTPRELPPFPGDGQRRWRKISLRKSRRRKRRRGGDEEEGYRDEDGPTPSNHLENSVVVRHKLAVDLQGRYVGIFPRFLAWFTDEVIILALFLLALLLVELIVKLATRKYDFAPKEWEYIPIFYFVWQWSYTAGCLIFTRRTIGMALFGQLLVQTDGRRVGPIRVILRTCFSVFTIVTIFGFVIGWIRRDGRQLHDLIFCTGVVYSWDAHLARLRDEAMFDDDERTL